MCPTYLCFSTAARPLGLSYRASRHRFCSPSSGAGRSTTTASIVSSSSLQSGTLAPAITAPSGPPSASTSTLFLVPFLPRSVGFLPVFSPPNRDLPQYRLTNHNHCLSKGFLQGWKLAMLRSLLLPLGNLPLDHTRIDPVATRADPLVLDLPEQPPIPRIESDRRPGVTFRQPALQDLERPGERQP